jgi:putative sterol carrier protein
MTVADEVKKIFAKLPDAFIPEQADGVTATIQLELSGEGAGNWIVKVANRALTVEPGQAGQPDLTLSMDAADYVALSKGQANPMALFAAGKVKLQGNMALAMKFQQMFNRS